MDGIFLEQVWGRQSQPAAPSVVWRTAHAGGSAARLDFFLVEQGTVVTPRREPARSCRGVPDKPEGANYYPPDATRDEIARWIDGPGRARIARRRHRLLHDDSARTVDRTVDGGAIQSRISGPAGARAAEHLRQAARLTQSTNAGTLPGESGREAFLPRTTTTRAMSPGCSSTHRSNQRSAPTRCTKTSGSTTRRPSKRL